MKHNSPEIVIVTISCQRVMKREYFIALVVYILNNCISAKYGAQFCIRLCRNAMAGQKLTPQHFMGTHFQWRQFQNAPKIIFEFLG